MLDNLTGQIKQALSGSHTTKIARFILNVASSTPIVGGVFSATAAAWSEGEQAKTNKLLSTLQQLTDDSVVELKNSLALVTRPQHIVAGSITFNPNTTEIFETFGVTSITDNGTLDFAVNLVGEAKNYLVMCYGSGPVTIEKVSQSHGCVRIALRHPAPDRVTLALFEEQTNISLEHTPGR